MRLARFAQIPGYFGTAPISGKVLQSVVHNRSEDRRKKAQAVVIRGSEAPNNEIVARDIKLKKLGAGLAILKQSLGSSRRRPRELDPIPRLGGVHPRVPRQTDNGPT